MNVKLKETLHIGDTFEYQYDFGSTTYITLEVVDKIKVSKSHSQIEILARNNEIHYADNEYGDYFNSPRDGVCGYIGSKDAELPYMPGNNNTYKLNRNKPILDDCNSDYNEYNNDLLNKLLSYADSCDGNVTQHEIQNILDEEISNMYSRIFEETTNDYIDEIRKLFKKCIFSFDLETLLNGYTKPELKEISKTLNLKISSASRKSTYVQKLIEMYPEYIKNEIYKMDTHKYNILKNCINNNGILNISNNDILNNVQKNLDNYMFFAKKGIIFPSFHDDEIIFVMPSAFQNIFNNVNTYEVKQKIKNNTEIINVFRGMIKAYGILSYDDTIMLLKKYCNNFDEENIITILKENEHYYLDEYDVIEEINPITNDEIKLFSNYEIEDYEEILSEIDNSLEYSYINKEKLISMADSDYLEKSSLGKKYIKELLNFFIIPKEYAIENMYSLVDAVQTTNLNEIIETSIQSIDCELEKEDQFAIEQIINKLLKNVPMWKFKGATINEIQGEKTTEKLKNKTVGRNEPCPCGSGKKYKNCCGKVINLFQ